MLLFKINYSYKLKTLLTPRQAKKTSEIVKERMELFYIVLAPTFFTNIIVLLRATANNIYFDSGRNVLYSLVTSEIVYNIK